MKIKVQLAVTAADKDISRKMEAVLHVNGRIPLLSISQVDGAGPVTEDIDAVEDVVYNTEYASAKLSAPDEATTYNAIIDPDDDTRFTLIAKTSGLIGSREGNIWHDSLTKELLLVPELSSLGTDVTTDIVKGYTHVIEAYALGGVTIQGVSPAMTAYKPEGAWCSDVPAPTATKASLLSISVEGQPGYANEIDVNLGVYSARTSMPALSVLSLGSTDATFGGDIYLYRLVKTGPSAHLLSAGVTTAPMVSFIYPW